FQQRVHLCVAATESAIHCAGVLRSSVRQDPLAESLAILARQATVLSEPSVRIVVDHRAPNIRVVARGVTRVPDMREISGVIAWSNLRHIDVETLQRCRLEGVDAL